MAACCSEIHVPISLPEAISKLPLAHRIRASVQGVAKLAATVLLAWLPSSTTAQPAPEQVDIAKHARGLKIYVYDLAAAGLMPALTTLSPASHACRNADLCRTMPHVATVADLCNYGFGTPLPAPWASPLQGTLWSNGDNGLSLTPMVHSRLLRGHRVVTDPAEADLFFLPLDVVKTCKAQLYERYRQCGVNYSRYQDFTRFWLWLHVCLPSRRMLLLSHITLPCLFSTFWSSRAAMALMQPPAVF